MVGINWHAFANRQYSSFSHDLSLQGLMHSPFWHISFGALHSVSVSQVLTGISAPYATQVPLLQVSWHVSSISQLPSLHVMAIFNTHLRSPAVHPVCSAVHFPSLQTCPTAHIMASPHFPPVHVEILLPTHCVFPSSHTFDVWQLPSSWQASKHVSGQAYFPVKEQDDASSSIIDVAKFLDSSFVMQLPLHITGRFISGHAAKQTFRFSFASQIHRSYFDGQ